MMALVASASAAPSAAEPTGRWLFVDDGSGVEIAPCSNATDGLCGTLVQLPKDSASGAGAGRRQLCGYTMLGALKEGQARKGELRRFDGWVVDPEELARTDRPKRYGARLIIKSDASAQLDVLGPLNLVLESHRLVRPATPAMSCE